MTRRLVQAVVASDGDHLRKLVYLAIKSNGPRCNLNHIDVSQVTDMSRLFLRRAFDGDISRWNTKNVTNMNSMFKESQFNGNITGWNVSRVLDMGSMFEDSYFNKDISRWSVGNVTTFEYMFAASRFAGNISTWCVAPQASAYWMFPRAFKGTVPSALSPWQWKSLFLNDPVDQATYFAKAPFVPGMTWWLHLAQEPSFSDTVPKHLHPLLRDTQALGRDLRMPRLDIATVLSMGYPMSANARERLHRTFQEHYVTSSAMVDLLRPDGQMDHATWLFGIPRETKHRVALVLAAAEPNLVQAQSFEMFDLPSMV